MGWRKQAGRGGVGAHRDLPTEANGAMLSMHEASSKECEMHGPPLGLIVFSTNGGLQSTASQPHSQPHSRPPVPARQPSRHQATPYACPPERISPQRSQVPVCCYCLHQLLLQRVRALVPLNWQVLARLRTRGSGMVCHRTTRLALQQPGSISGVLNMPKPAAELPCCSTRTANTSHSTCSPLWAAWAAHSGKSILQYSVLRLFHTPCGPPPERG